MEVKCVFGDIDFDTLSHNVLPCNAGSLVDNVPGDCSDY